MNHYPGVLLPLLPCLLAFSCSPPPPSSSVNPVEPAEESVAGEFPETGGTPVLILRTGDQPLWFELTAEGPRQVYSPGEASLKPFEPWPLARYVAGMLAGGEGLVMAVNRDGFLSLGAGTGEAAGDTELRRAADPAYWGRYTVGSLFRYGNVPGALLYRNDFFSELSAEAPEPPAWGLLPGEAAPVPLKLPALAALSVEGWEPGGLRRGNDAAWYYRGIRRDSPQPETRYFSGTGLDRPGAEVSLGAYRNSAQPEGLSRAPPVLAEALAAAFLLAGRGALCIAGVNSPEFPAPRYFSAGEQGAGEGENLLELSGFYRGDFSGPSGGTFAAALVILPGGQGVYARSGVADPALVEKGPFNLPPLPEGFVYTGLGVAGKAVLAPWEERLEGSIGAAGFMALDMIPLSR